MEEIITDEKEEGSENTSDDNKGTSGESKDTLEGRSYNTDEGKKKKLILQYDDGQSEYENMKVSRSLVGQSDNENRRTGRTLPANLGEGKKEKHVLQYADGQDDQEDVRRTRGPRLTGKKEKVNLQYDDRLYNHEDESILKRSVPEGESVKKNNEGSAPNSARNTTAVGAYRVPNYLRRNKKDERGAREISSDADVSQADTPVGAFRVQPGAYVPTPDHHNDDETTSTTSSSRNTATVGAYRVPNYLRRNKRDSAQTQEAVSNTNVAQTDTPVGDSCFQPGVYASLDDHHNDEGTASVASSSRNTTTVGAYRVPNYLRRNKRDSAQTQEIQSDTVVSSPQHPNDNRATSITSPSRSTTTIGAFRVPNYLRRNKRDSSRANSDITSEDTNENQVGTFHILPGDRVSAKRDMHRLEISDPLTEPKEGRLGAFRVLPGDQIPKKQGKHQLEIRDPITEPDSKIIEQKRGDKEKNREENEESPQMLADAQIVTNMNLQLESIQSNDLPGAHRMGGSNQDDDDGINTVYQYQDYYNQESNETQPQQQYLPNDRVISESTDYFHQDYNNHQECSQILPDGFRDRVSSQLSPSVDSKVDKKKLWMVLIAVIVMIVAVSLGGIFIVAIRAEREGSYKMQRAMGEIRDLIVSKFPQSKKVLVDESSSQYQALAWVSRKKIEDPGFYTDERILIQYSLMTFFKSTDYESNFSELSDECDWGGVTCNRKSKTLNLILHNKILIGTLPPDIALLPLRNLILIKNIKLSGSIPTEIGLISALQKISISENEVSGTIPSEIGLLSNIQTISLYENLIDGSIPSEIGLLSDIQKLDLQSSSINGYIPSEFGLLINLKKLVLHNNELVGSIPSEIGLLKKMEGISAGNNYLTGTIPSEILLPNQLTLLLDSNKFNGTIPSEIGLLSQVKNINMQRNKLSGVIPSEIGLLKPNLKTLYLSENQLQGSIPSELGLLNQALNLEIASNDLEGSIPTEIGLLVKVTTLSLKHNDFSGTIPSQFGQLTRLSNLYLSYNKKLTVPNTLCEVKQNGVIHASDTKVVCECCDNSS